MIRYTTWRDATPFFRWPEGDVGGLFRHTDLRPPTNTPEEFVLDP